MGIGPYLYMEKVIFSCIYDNVVGITDYKTWIDWIKAPFISDDYQKGVESFLHFAQENRPALGEKYFFSLC